MRTTPFTSIDDVRVRLAEAGYIASNAVATTVYLASELGKPLLVEGPAGVGKTELARAVATATSADLVRLQCYEGVDEARALYELSLIHISEPTRQAEISYAVFCLKKKN